MAQVDLLTGGSYQSAEAPRSRPAVRARSRVAMLAGGLFALAGLAGVAVMAPDSPVTGEGTALESQATSLRATAAAADETAYSPTEDPHGEDKHYETTVEDGEINAYGYLESKSTIIDNMVWIHMPSVVFSMGASQIESQKCFNGYMTDVNKHLVSLSTFSMSKSEITVKQYKDFLNEANAAGWLEVRHTNDNDAWYWEELDLVIDKDNPFTFVVGSELMGEYAGKYWTWLDAPPDTESVFGTNVNHIFYDWSTDSFSLKDEDMYDWPMATVSWYAAEAFSRFYGLSLPTEAQWEYAAGGGGVEVDPETGEVSSTGAKDVYPSVSANMPNTAEMNFDGSSMDRFVREGGETAVHSQPSKGSPTPVCTYPTNNRGFCDMGGNVFEWVYDWYDPFYYIDCAPGDIETPGGTRNSVACVDGVAVNPRGPDTGEFEPLLDGSCDGAPLEDFTCSTRVRRGGAYNYLSEFTCSFKRASGLPFRMMDHFGFRVVTTIGQEGELNSGTSASEAR